MIQLSRRLAMTAALVSKGRRVADIGCDHGYTSIYLCQSGQAERVIAMDVNQGPLTCATHNISKYNLSDRIETRLSDGADCLHKDEVDVFLISGMGGMLIIQILDKAYQNETIAEELILQPQSDISEVRKYLHEHQYKIAKEAFTTDEGKDYFTIKAIRGIEIYETWEYEFGTYLPSHMTMEYYDYLSRMERKITHLIQSVPNEKRIQELKETLSHIFACKQIGEKDGERYGEERKCNHNNKREDVSLSQGNITLYNK